MRLRVCLVQRNGRRDQVHEGEAVRGAEEQGCDPCALPRNTYLARSLHQAARARANEASGAGVAACGSSVREVTCGGEHYRDVSQKSAGLVHEAKAGKKRPLAVPWDWGCC